MKPSQVAAQLTHIAAKLQNSKNPDRASVATELKTLINKIAVDNMSHWSKEIQRLVNGMSVESAVKIADGSFDLSSLAHEIMGLYTFIQKSLDNDFWAVVNDNTLFIFLGSEEEVIDKLRVSK